MNQDFTEKKSKICLKKDSCRGFHLKKKNIRAEVVSKKKKFEQPENSPPPSLIFLMVRP